MLRAISQRSANGSQHSEKRIKSGEIRKNYNRSDYERQIDT